MPQLALFRLAQIGRKRLVLLAGLLLVILVGLSWLGVSLVRQVEEQSETRTDNAQWLLSQFELELLYLLNVADTAAHDGNGLAEVRLRYDIFIGRLKMLREGRVSEQLRGSPGIEEDFARLDAFMQKYLPAIDGTDAALQAQLENLVADGRELTEVARSISLTGVKVAASQSDARRLLVARTLAATGTLTIFLVTFLLALLFLLLQLYRFNRQRSAENLATLSRLNAVVSTAMEALVTVDDGGRIVDFNEAALLALGLKANEARGRDMAELFAPAEGEVRLFRHGKAPDVASQGRYRVTARASDGRLFPAEVSISRVTGMEAVLFVVFLRDLSAQLAAEQALVDARDTALAGEKAKAELLAVMSHEIRTPLNGMIGTIELLDATDLAPKQREYLRILQASGRLLMHHVNDVLDITRLDSGRARPAQVQVDLAEIVREVIENQLPASQDNGNALTFTPPEGGHFVVLSDGAQLRQILLNLVGNAVKFTRDGKIDVALEGDGTRTRIRVSDTGIGIAGGDLDRIFDDFVTLDASYARNASGTGLGLGIVRRIVAQMGGELTVDSRQGVGSTFCVTLPLRREDAVAVPDLPAGGNSPGQPLVALVVEDNDFNRLIVAEFLRRDGHEVVEANDGESGIELAGQRRFDVILMDISMPGMDGLQATQAIRSGQGPSRDVPIVAMTAHALQEERARFRAGGMGWVLIKPITRETLREVLRQATNGLNSGAVLDHVLLAGLAEDLGKDRAAGLIRRFRSEVAEIGGKVVAAGPGKCEDAALRRQVHQLAGSSAMFGALALAQALRQIESSWKLGTPVTPDDMKGLDQARLATQAALQDDALAQLSSLR